MALYLDRLPMIMETTEQMCLTILYNKLHSVMRLHLVLVLTIFYIMAQNIGTGSHARYTGCNLS